MITRSAVPVSFWPSAAAGAVTLFFCAMLPPQAQAACFQVGNAVDCTGNDFNGFLSQLPLNLRTYPDTFIQNVITGERIGTCPLSFPAIALGSGSSVVNQGTISTSGVCGFGVVVGGGSSVVNAGTIRTGDLVSSGIVADDGSVVRNSGLILTEFQSSAGIVGGGSMRITNVTGAWITTAGAGSAGIESGHSSILVNEGRITAAGDASIGIDAGSGSSVTNSGTIETTANNSRGIRAAGSAVVNAGSVRSLLAGPAFALTPTVGIDLTGSSARLTNAAGGSVTATHIGVRIGGTQEAGLANSGRIEATPAFLHDGTPLRDGGAIVVAGPSGAGISNAGTIMGHGGLPAIRSLGAAVTLENRGRIVGDVLLSRGDDTIVLLDSSAVEGAIDFGGGNDLLAFRNGGNLDHTITNLERLSQAGTNPLMIRRSIVVAEQVTVLGGGGIRVDRDIRLSTPLTESIGLVRGHGTLDGSINNGGVVAPGGVEKGVLTVTGAYRQTESGTLAIRISPDGTSDRLIVGGAADFGGALAISFDRPQTGGTFRDGQRFDVVLPAAGALSSTGRFTLATPQQTFLTANIVTTAVGGLAVEIDRRSYASVGVTDSQRSIGRLLDSAQALPPLQETVSRLESADPPAATQILADLAPEAPGGVQNLNLLALDRFAEKLRSRVHSDAGKRAAWALGFASSGRSRDAGAPADYQLQGAVAGADVSAGGLRVGVAAAVVGGDFMREGDHAAFDTSLFALTSRYEFSAGSVDAAVVHGGGSPRMRRVRGSASSTTAADTSLWSASVGGTLTASAGPVSLHPFAGLVFHRAELMPFDENRVLGIRSRASVAKSLRAHIGARAAPTSGHVRPFGEISVSAETFARQPTIGAALIGAEGSEFKLFGEVRRRVSLDAEAGISADISERLEVHVTGGLTANDLLAGRRISAGLAYRW